MVNFGKIEIIWKWSILKLSNFRNDEKNAGFSTADKTWLPVADNYKQVNVQQEESADKSHLKVYKSLKELRKEPALQDGNTKYAALGQQVVAIARFDFH